MKTKKTIATKDLFSVKSDFDMPSKKLIKVLKKVEKDIVNKKNLSPIFYDVDDLVTELIN
ncbi:MAG: hypothetical protein WC666_01245 [Candidatus Paceibacterota bacterium]